MAGYVMLEIKKGGTHMVIVVFKRLRAERQVVDRFRQAGACSVDLAKPLAELESPVFYKLLRQGVIVHAGSKKYFLDEKQLMQHRLNRVKWAMIVLFLVILLLLWWVPRMR
jgi:hypothetical protein